MNRESEMQRIENPGRRNFLRSAGLGSAGAAAAIVGRVRGPDMKPTPAAAAERPRGYRASPHILRYYETTKV